MQDVEALSRTGTEEALPEARPTTLRLGPLTFTDHQIWLTLITLAIAALWLRPIGSSLWLDETGTYWIVKDSLSEAIGRAARFGLVPTYYVIAWVARVLGGGNEVVLRLPSVLAMLATTWLVFRLGQRLFDREAGRLAAIVFASMGWVAFTAVDARPYAFAFLTLTASTLALVRWLDEGNLRMGLAYAILVAATISFHYLFACAFVAHGVYVAYRLYRGLTRIRLRHAGAVLGTAVACLAPMAPLFSTLLSRREIMSDPLKAATFDVLLSILLPDFLVKGLVLGLGLAVSRNGITLHSDTTKRESLLLAVSWTLLPPVLLFLVATGTSSNVLFWGYARSAAAGAALLLGWGLRHLSPAATKRIVVSAVVLVSVILWGGQRHGGDDWRGAARSVNSVSDWQTPVLAHVGFAETGRLGQDQDSLTRDALLAPFSRYPVRGSLVLMPRFPDTNAEPYLEGLITSTLARSERFVFVAWRGSALEIWLKGRMAGEGFGWRLIAEHGEIDVLLFERT